MDMTVLTVMSTISPLYLTRKKSGKIVIFRCVIANEPYRPVEIGQSLVNVVETSPQMICGDRE